MRFNHTLNSASTNPLPKQVLEPSAKVSKWLNPWISLAFSVIPASSTQRSGTNSFAFGPHILVDLFMHRIGIVTVEPFVTTTWSTFVPDRVIKGALRGRISSFVALKGISLKSKPHHIAIQQLTRRSASKAGEWSRSTSRTTALRYGSPFVN